MEEAQITKSSTLPVSPDVINELVDIKENVSTPPKKVHVLLWIIIGLAISLILVGIGTLTWKLIQSTNSPDLTITAPSVLHPSATPIPTPTGETTTLIPQDILFESKPYRNELSRFEIQIPQGWQVDDTGKSGAIVVLIDPKATLASNSAILTFISVSVGTASDTLENEVNTIRNGLKETFNSYKIEEDKQMFLSGNTYHLIGGSYLINGTKMRNRNLILIYGNRGYAISATAPESTWSKKELVLNASVFSFKNF